jgi:hypothetical protein
VLISFLSKICSMSTLTLALFLLTTQCPQVLPERQKLMFKGKAIQVISPRSSSMQLLIIVALALKCTSLLIECLFYCIGIRNAQTLECSEVALCSPPSHSHSLDARALSSPARTVHRTNGPRRSSSAPT